MPGKKPTRILQVIARLNIGGPAIYAISLANDLSKELYKILLVCGRVGPHEGDMSYLAGEKSIALRILPDFGREISVFDDLKAFNALRKILRQFNPDIIHTHTAKAGTLGRLAGIFVNLTRGRKRKIRLIHTFHGHVFYGYFNSLRTVLFIFIEKILAQFTDRIFVISQSQQYDICQRYKIARSERVKVTPLGFDLSRFAAIHSGIKEDKKRYFPHESGDILLVGIIGRLTKVKNHKMFLEALKHLKEEGNIKFFRFLVIGDGELREMLMEYSNELDVQNYVVFTGWQRDMPSIYKALDTVVLTSLNEGTPVTLIEAMAAGRSVIATDVGGVRDLFGRVEKRVSSGYTLTQNGILVPSGKSESLSKALLYLRHDRKASKKMTEAARKFVINHYSLKNVESIYSELLAVIGT